jgi:Lon protease-like protein
MTGSFLVDFGNPIALFPLVGVVLYPHTVRDLHIFEPRYRQMIEHAVSPAIDGDLGQSLPIAMSVLEKGVVSCDSLGMPPLRRVACIGRLLKDHKLPDGRHFIRLHGVCRAEIRHVEEPEGDRLYRRAFLKPINQAATNIPKSCRGRLHDLLSGDRLVRMRLAEEVRGYVEKDDISLETVVEIASFVLVQDESIRYRLLAERDPSRRALILFGELERLDQLVELCDLQQWKDWPKGLSWN